MGNVNMEARQIHYRGGEKPMNVEEELDSLKSGLTNIDNEVNGDATLYPYADVITIEDAVPSNLADCSVKIEPVQSGSGDPSPENIRPITGHTEVDVQRMGKNLFDKDNINSINKYYDGARWINQASGQWKTIFIPVIAGRTYTSSGFPNTAGANSVFVKADKSTVLLAFSSANNNSTFVVPDTAEYVGFAIWSRDEDYTIAQLELGQTATTYEPYQGKTYTIALGDTIYGGTVDFDSGVMTVDRAYAEFDGSEDENWIYEYFQQMYHNFYINISDSKQTALQSELLVNEVPTNYGNGYAWISQGKNLNVCIGNAIEVDTAASFKEWLSNNPLQAVYPLATPFTIQLTHQQIQLLKGQNTLTASTGQISVTVNGVSGSIGQVQEQVNATDAVLAELAADIAEQLPIAPTTDGAYVLTVTVADGTPTYSWESGS